MRCYLMKGGHIQNVVILREGTDEELIEQAGRVLEAHRSMGIEGVEVWHGARFVYCSPDPPKSA